MDFWGNNILGRGKNNCKGSKSGSLLGMVKERSGGQCSSSGKGKRKKRKQGRARSGLYYVVLEASENSEWERKLLKLLSRGVISHVGFEESL